METPKTFLIFQDTDTLKNLLYFKKNFQSHRNKNLLNFSKKRYEQIFPKTLSHNSFYLFYKLNQTILLVYKNIESFPLC